MAFQQGAASPRVVLAGLHPCQRDAGAGVREAVRRFDQALAEEARPFPNVQRLELAGVLSQVGEARALDPRMYLRALAPYTPAFHSDLARRIAASGKLLEVNTASLFYARRETCAGPFLLERYRAHGGRDITLASDSHEAGQLRRGFTEAAPMLKRLGFDAVCLPWDREHPVPLDEYVS